MYRIGNGYDVHAFEDGGEIILGGVRIPFEKSFKAHSDGDVLIHAICDAILGAIGAGDIGKHFPDTDPQFKAIDSKVLLLHVISLMQGKGYELVNCDNTIVAQHPKLNPYIEEMKQSLMGVLPLKKNNALNIKATTTEKLGFAGRGEGIAVYSVVLLVEAGI